MIGRIVDMIVDYPKKISPTVAIADSGNREAHSVQPQIGTTGFPLRNLLYRRFTDADVA
jgi:hypothetical protein